ncbi:hypothetical protein GQ44DRAFT_729875 [Phaeosphaeriaceae sp. PMI808]|nr:hypothetical protein GQ44DRAFT_729875 [Phaeosphaeriaceae sp. PMI808]
MATNAPYFQISASQSTTTLNGTDAAAPSPSEPGDEEYDIFVPTVISSHESHSPLPFKHLVHQASANTPMNTIEENRHLPELLEAATTAAGQAAQARHVHGTGVAETEAHSKGKRSRPSSLDTGDSATPKRQRVEVPTDPQLQSAGHNSYGNSKRINELPSKEVLRNNARAAGVHSAAALFRWSSSEMSRKHSRPPMFKLYVSLELTPENFLKLQAQAKVYMLDEDYPERQNCVGNRKGDADLVKLKLFNCVQKFLNDGVGEYFFGKNAERQGERVVIEAACALGQAKDPSTEDRVTWPKDEGKLINLVTPLMKRMVTNERQRKYAIKTRKRGTKGKPDECNGETATQQSRETSSSSSTRRQSPEQQLQIIFDPSLVEISHKMQSTSPSITTRVTPGQTPIAERAPLRKLISREDETLNTPNLQLPTNTPGEPSLTNINIFLVLAPHTTPNSTITPSTKIDEKRISKPHPNNLTSHPWHTFLHKIIKLLQKAKSTHPEICRSAIPQQNHRYPPHSPVPDDTFSDTLRELAVAANAMQSEDSGAGGGCVSGGVEEVVLPRLGVIDMEEKDKGGAGYSQAWFNKTASALARATNIRILALSSLFPTSVLRLPAPPWPLAPLRLPKNTSASGYVYSCP